MHRKRFTAFKGDLYMVSNTTANSLVSPFGLKSEDGYVWLKGNPHSHTTNSDGRVSPQERVDGYIEHGYDFLCITDHGTITPINSVTCPDNFILIQSAELHPQNPFGGQPHHFLAFNIKEHIEAPKMPPQHVIDQVKEQGGSIWLAHPYWSSVNIIQDTLPLHGLAGVEVFNTTCQCAGRGESSVHWTDWREKENKLYPAIGSDDSHAADTEERDTYRGWTMVRVKELTAGAIIEAMEKGSGYSSSGPEIHDIQLKRVDESKDDRVVVEATVRSSEARRIVAVCDTFGTEYRNKGRAFKSAAFNLPPNARWVRFEVVGPDGSKAWSNPFDLTSFK